MRWHYVQTLADEGEARNAGAKAPADVNDILHESGFVQLLVRDVPNRADAGRLQKVRSHRVALRNWLDAIEDLADGDGIVMQLPFACHTIWFGKVISVLRKRGIRLVLLVHDLESVRLGLTGGAGFAQTQRFKLEESALFSYAQAIIVHNDAMADFLASYWGYSRERLVPLGLFDYLTSCEKTLERPVESYDTVAVAGNLRHDKAGYVYDVPDDVDFLYYGVGYEVDASRPRVAYQGSFSADELPAELRGGFGLVWDGPEGRTCTGVYGAYLTINNPHKTSLYLASGLPIITWSQAAIARVVEDEGVGLCVDSLYELRSALDAVSEDEYRSMVANASRIGRRLRAGAYTKEAVRQACEIAEG